MKFRSLEEAMLEYTRAGKTVLFRSLFSRKMLRQVKGGLDADEFLHLQEEVLDKPIEELFAHKFSFLVAAQGAGKTGAQLLLAMGLALMGVNVKWHAQATLISSHGSLFSSVCQAAGIRILVQYKRKKDFDDDQAWEKYAKESRTFVEEGIGSSNCGSILVCNQYAAMGILKGVGGWTTTIFDEGNITGKAEDLSLDKGHYASVAKQGKETVIVAASEVDRKTVGQICKAIGYKHHVAIFGSVEHIGNSGGVNFCTPRPGTTLLHVPVSGTVKAVVENTRGPIVVMVNPTATDQHAKGWVEIYKNLAECFTDDSSVQVIRYSSKWFLQLQKCTAEAKRPVLVGPSTDLENGFDLPGWLACLVNKPKDTQHLMRQGGRVLRGKSLCGAVFHLLPEDGKENDIDWLKKQAGIVNAEANRLAESSDAKSCVVCEPVDASDCQQMDSVMDRWKKANGFRLNATTAEFVYQTDSTAKQPAAL